MAPVFAEDLHHQVRETVDHLGLIAEAFGGVDHAQDLDHSFHLVQTAQDTPGRAQQVDPDIARDLVAVLGGEVPAELAPRRGAALANRSVAGEEEEVADPDTRDVVPYGLCGRWEGDAELFDLRLCAHEASPREGVGGASIRVPWRVPDQHCGESDPGSSAGKVKS